MRERLLHIEKLEQAARRGAFVRLLIGSSLNLVVEEIIEVSCVQYPSACKQTLLEAGLEGPSAYREKLFRHVTPTESVQPEAHLYCRIGYCGRNVHLRLSRACPA